MAALLVGAPQVRAEDTRAAAVVSMFGETRSPPGAAVRLWRSPQETIAVTRSPTLTGEGVAVAVTRGGTTQGNFAFYPPAGATLTPGTYSRVVPVAEINADRGGMTLGTTRPWAGIRGSFGERGSVPTLRPARLRRGPGMVLRHQRHRRERLTIRQTVAAATIAMQIAARSSASVTYGGMV